MLYVLLIACSLELWASLDRVCCFPHPPHSPSCAPVSNCGIHFLHLLSFSPPLPLRSEPEKVPELDQLQSDVKEALFKNIRRRLTPHPVKIRADLELTCFTYEGIDAIKDSLYEGLKFSTEQYPISVSRFFPSYSMWCGVAVF